MLPVPSLLPTGKCPYCLLSSSEGWAMLTLSQGPLSELSCGRCQARAHLCIPGASIEYICLCRQQMVFSGGSHCPRSPSLTFIPPRSIERSCTSWHALVMVLPRMPTMQTPPGPAGQSQDTALLQQEGAITHPSLCFLRSSIDESPSSQ